MRTIAIAALTLGLIPLANAQYQASYLDSTPNGGEALAVGGGQQVGVGNTASGTHAMLWSGSSGTQIDLHPAAASISYAYGVGGGKQVGYATISGNPKAMLWSGTAASAINLAPPGTTISFAYATDGLQQVGAVRTTSTNLQAVVWSGTAASAISLRPSTAYATSQAQGVDAGYQVGFAAASGHIYACVWHGSAASYVSIDPAGTVYSEAHAVKGTQVVGEYGDLATGGQYAALWTSFSPLSFVSLKPAWLDGNNYAWSTNGTVQVGYGIDSSNVHHGIVWHGTAASAFDLNTILPAGATGSEAWGVDADGNVVGITFFGALERATIWRPACVVSGHVDLNDFGGLPGLVMVTLELRDPGSPVVLETHNVALNASGNYQFQTLLRGTYDISAKASHWLRQIDLSIDTSGSAATADFALTNGDCDGDNEITLADYAVLATAFGSVPADANWNSNADLDGDEEVTLADYSILASHFGQAGDE